MGLEPLSRQGRTLERWQQPVKAGELSTQGGVLKEQRRRQRGRDTQMKVLVQILDLPLQLHPPVLKPRFHLKKKKKENIETSVITPSYG